MPVAFSRYQQKPYAALVRHEDLWKPDEGAAIQSAASGMSHHFGGVSLLTDWSLQ